jgi:hypothetical protein
MKELIKHLLRENLDYIGGHEAPDSSNIPIYDMTKEYPDDIYSSEAIRLYGDHSDEYSDAVSINIINYLRNKPNKLVKIYRAVPDLSYETSKEIKNINNIISYYYKYRFFPIKNQIIHDIEDEIGDDWSDYEERQKQILDKLYEKIDKLKLDVKKLKINSGDWVTINQEYAKVHGKANFKNYKILTKTVKANTLFTYGDSIHEWGYNP